MPVKRNFFVTLVSSIIIACVFLFGCSKPQSEEKKVVEKSEDQPQQAEPENGRKGMSKEAAEFFKKADDF